MADIVTHEMGHHLEMWHTGASDHFDFSSRPSLLAICEETYAGSPLTVQTELTADDYAHVIHKWGGATFPPVQANHGFEAGLTYWKTSSVSIFDLSTADPYNGSNSVRWKPSSAGGYVYQTTNFVKAGGHKIDARTAYKKVFNEATNGDLRLQIQRQKIDYGFAHGPPQKDCEYEQFQPGATVDQNERQVLYGYQVIRTEFLTPTASWQLGTETNTHTFSSTWEGFDVRVRVRSDVKKDSDGSFALIDIHDTRVRDRG